MLSLSFDKLPRNSVDANGMQHGRIHKKRAAWGIGSVLLGAIVASGVAAFGYDQYKRAETNTLVTQFASQMTELPAIISGLYTSQRNFTGLSATVLLNNGAIPDKWQNADGDGIVHLGGSAITVAAASTSQAAFVMRFTDLPQALCRKAVSDGLGAAGYQSGNSATGTISASTIGPSSSGTLCAADMNAITATFLK